MFAFAGKCMLQSLGKKHIKFAYNEYCLFDLSGIWIMIALVKRPLASTCLKEGGIPTGEKTEAF